MKVATRMIAFVSANSRAIESVIADKDSMKEKNGQSSWKFSVSSIRSMTSYSVR